jgi:hypothetical protein
MSHEMTSAADSGRSCPYCRFPLKQGAEAWRCDACNSLHHEDCWRDGSGCAILGCTEAGQDAATHAASATGTGASPPTSAYPGPHPPLAPPPLAPARTGNPTMLTLAVAIALLGIGAGAVVATGALSGGGSHRTNRPTTEPTQPQPAPSPTAGPSPGEQAADRQAIVGLLDTYQRDYSAHNTAGLTDIFSAGIKRHGLAAGGCVVSHGRSAVLDNYRSQFEEGSGSYELLGLSPGQVHLEGRTRAGIDAHYRITPGGTGYVNFRFVNPGNGWKVSEVNATCA